MFPKSLLDSVYTAGFDMHVKTCMFKTCCVIISESFRTFKVPYLISVQVYSIMRIKEKVLKKVLFQNQFRTTHNVVIILKLLRVVASQLNVLCVLI